MSENTRELDALIGALLREEASAAHVDDAALARLRHGTVERATPELARRRASYGAATAVRRRRLWPVAAATGLLAASVAGVLATGAIRSGAGGALETPQPELSSIDRILDADLSDAQFRAVLSGAADAEALLRLAAADPEDG
jgi:hypothetical protein